MDSLSSLDVKHALPPQSWTTATLDAADLPGVVVVRVDIEDGVRVCDEITLRRRPGEPSLTANALRALPITGILRRCSPSPMKFVEIDAEGFEVYELVGNAERAKTYDAAKRPGGRPRLTDAFLESVAAAYRSDKKHPVEAVRTHCRPNQRTAEWDVPISAAKRWVTEARKRGQLGQAPKPRTKGEAQAGMKGGIS